MKCPVCLDPDLLLAERQGIEIDYCPKCRGVWLDRGELDKIIAQSANQTSFGGREVPRSGGQDHASFGEYRDSDNYRDGGYKDYREGDHKRKRRGFLGELFDFD